MRDSKEKSIVICSNYAWTIYNFRLPLIRSLKADGYRIIILTQFDGYEKYLYKEADKVLDLFISRKGINPFVDIFSIFNILYSLFLVKPDFLLNFSIKPAIYGSIAAKVMRVPSVSMITGLGTGFLLNNWITAIIKVLYRISIRYSYAVIFQNHDDLKIFKDNNLVDCNNCYVSPGSGIDLNSFKYETFPHNKPEKFILISRMLKDKGVIEYIEAAEIVNKIYPNTIFQLLGPLGVENRSAISNKEMSYLTRSNYIEYLGETDDVKNYIKKADCIILPSYREGTSRVLLEAASMGRPLIASNVTGCKEIIDNGFNGYLCESKNSIDLAEKIIKFLELSHDQKEQMGLNGRKKVEEEYDQEIVFNMYKRILNTRS